MKAFAWSGKVVRRPMGKELLKKNEKNFCGNENMSTFAPA